MTDTPAPGGAAMRSLAELIIAYVEATRGRDLAPQKRTDRVIEMLARHLPESGMREALSIHYHNGRMKGFREACEVGAKQCQALADTAASRDAKLAYIEAAGVVAALSAAPPKT